MASDLTAVEHTQTHFKRNLLISGNYDLPFMLAGFRLHRRTTFLSLSSSSVRCLARPLTTVRGSEKAGRGGEGEEKGELNEQEITRERRDKLTAAGDKREEGGTEGGIYIYISMCNHSVTTCAICIYT